MRGHLEHLDGDRWRLRLRAGRGPDGKYRTLSRNITATGTRDAERQATTIIAEWDAEAAANAKATGTVRELVDAYEQHRAKRDSPTTIAHRRTHLTQIRADLGKVRLKDLTARRIDAWLDTLEHPATPGQRARTAPTVHHYYRTLKAILRQGYRWGMIDTDPTGRATPPDWRKADTAPTMPHVADVQAMLAVASPVVQVAVKLAVASGARRGELMALHWSDLDLETGVLVISRTAVEQRGGGVVLRDPKTASGRRAMMLPPSMVAALCDHLAARDRWMVQVGQRQPKDGPIFADLTTDPTGRTAYTPGWMSGQWERLRVQIGRPGLLLKGLRALHASLLADGALPVAALARRQGHAQVSTTLNHYTHEMDGADRQAAVLLEAVMIELPTHVGANERT